MDQRVTPYLDALVKYVKTKPYAFHTPGHKQGRSIPQKLKNLLGNQIFEYDLDVDDIEDYQKVLEEAEALASKVYGAYKTFFLVQGSTLGIQAMVLAAVSNNPENACILMPRNVHKSVLSPIFIQPTMNYSLLIPHNISNKAVQSYFKKNKDIKALILNHPTYHGLTADIETIAKICHTNNKLLLVDEAWGAHFQFHQRLPNSAIAMGADIAVNSSHKLLSAMTQASMLHIGNNNSQLVESIRFFLELLQTSSPSCILRASIDCARMQMATEEGKELINKVIELSLKAREEISKIDGLYCLGEELINNEDIFGIDITKLVVNFQDCGYNGYEASELLYRDFKIKVEMADLVNIIIVLTIGDTEDKVNYLIQALKKIAKNKKKRKNSENIKQLFKTMGLPKQVMLPKEAVFSKKETLLIKDAVGRISAESIVISPPGVPLIWPGEVLTQEFIEFLEEYQNISGIRLIRPIRVVIE
jgi:arginine/lysine/ornithine decarboxylase